MAETEQMSVTEAPHTRGAAEPIAYATPPAVSRWQQFWSGAIIGISHVIAMGSLLFVLFVLPFVTYAVWITFELFRSAFNDLDGPPPILVPLILIVFLVFSAICILVAAAVTTFIVTIFGICADAVRRNLRWPFWLAPVIACGLQMLFWPTLILAIGNTGRSALVHGGWFTVAGTGLFLLYWTALFFSEQILRVAKWLFDRLFQSVQKWWRNKSGSAPARS
jgi:hypothetical protein